MGTKPKSNCRKKSKGQSIVRSPRPFEPSGVIAGLRVLFERPPKYQPLDPLPIVLIRFDIDKRLWASRRDADDSLIDYHTDCILIDVTFVDNGAEAMGKIVAIKPVTLPENLTAIKLDKQGRFAINGYSGADYLILSSGVKANIVACNPRKMVAIEK